MTALSYWAEIGPIDVAAKEMKKVVAMVHKLSDNRRNF